MSWTEPFIFISGRVLRGLRTTEERLCHTLHYSSRAQRIKPQFDFLHCRTLPWKIVCTASYRINHQAKAPWRQDMTSVSLIHCVLNRQVFVILHFVDKLLVEMPLLNSTDSPRPFSEGGLGTRLRLVSSFLLIYSTRRVLLTDYSQAMDDSASFPTLPLPLVHLRQQVEESLLGVGNISIRRPAQELELTHHQLALLELWNVTEKKKKIKHMQYDCTVL